MKKIFLITALAWAIASGPAAAQTSLDISPIYLQYHRDSVYFGDSLKWSVYVRNLGPSSFNGDIDVFTGVVTDSLGSVTVVHQDTSLYSTVGFAPGDSMGVYIPMTCDSPSFERGINTVVIWPATNTPNVSIGDSLYDTVYVIGFTGLFDLNRVPRPHLSISPNPVSGQARWIVFADKKDPEYVRILDMGGRVVKEYPVEDRYLDLRDLPAGLYTITVGLAGGQMAAVRILKL